MWAPILNSEEIFALDAEQNQSHAQHFPVCFVKKKEKKGGNNKCDTKLFKQLYAKIAEYVIYISGIMTVCHSWTLTWCQQSHSTRVKLLGEAAHLLTVVRGHSWTTSFVFSSTRITDSLVIPSSRGTSLFLPFIFSCQIGKHQTAFMSVLNTHTDDSRAPASQKSWLFFSAAVT